MATDRIRVYVKKQIQLDRLNFNQTQMLKIGTVALATVKNRVQAGKDENDATAKPLNKRYAITKSKRLGKRAVRDLTYTGDMLRNFQVRTVSENQAYASLTSKKQRDKAKALNALQRWIAYSPSNVKETTDAAQRVLNEKLPETVITRSLGS